MLLALTESEAGYSKLRRLCRRPQRLGFLCCFHHCWYQYPWSYCWYCWYCWNFCNCHLHRECLNVLIKSVAGQGSMSYSPCHKIFTSAFVYQLFQSLLHLRLKFVTHGQTCNQHLPQVCRPPTYDSSFPLPDNFPLFRPQILWSISNCLFLQLLPRANRTREEFPNALAYK